MRRERYTAAVALAGLALVVVLIVTSALDAFLPAGLALHVSQNNEGFVLALLLGPWLGYVRGRGAGDVPWLAAGVLALVMGAVGVALLAEGMPATLRTLNESFFAMALLVLYVRVARPLPVWGWALPAGAILFPLVTMGTTVSRTLAETYGAIVLLPLTLDWAARFVLERDQRPHPARIIVWTGFLIVAPIALFVVRPDHPVRPVEGLLHYLSRATEAFVAALLIHAYFSVTSLRDDSPGHDAGAMMSGRAARGGGR